jgi:hypothetical protein
MLGPLLAPEFVENGLEAGAVQPETLVLNLRLEVQALDQPTQVIEHFVDVVRSLHTGQASGRCASALHWKSISKLL